MNLRFMRRALTLARRFEGRTSPNPPVGAVVVSEEKIVGEGFHRGPGTPHAEVVALAAAGGRASGADIYVTLEPCSHHGRTPPCTDAIINAGISRVIIGMKDPHTIEAAFCSNPVIELDDVKRLDRVPSEKKHIITFSQNQKKVDMTTFYLKAGIEHIHLYETKNG